jgi:Na+/H+ antiporter NhaD/arsenite permease-like protein
MGGAGPDLGQVLPLWSAIPFVGMLLSIALGPLLVPRVWHHHSPQVAVGWGLLLAVPFLASYRGRAGYEILHILLADYVPFVLILFGLYTVAGGIVVRGRFAGTPAFNTAYLAFGALLASWIGTTGASMLLIRPLLRANEVRRHRVHVVVFFIFLVSNIGGCLTPLGDPPLFLGFLRGVPFFWTLFMAPLFALVGGLVLAAFLAVDLVLYRRERREGGIAEVPIEESAAHGRFRIDGLHNLAFLAGIVGAVLLSGVWDAGDVDVVGVHLSISGLVRDGIIVAMALLSLRTTRKEFRVANGFTWEPMREVAILFLGIFTTIIPALAILRAGESGPLGAVLQLVQTPAHYFWATGALSSFLDNAPTYLAFLSLELGRIYPGLPEAQAIARLVVEHPYGLEAVSAGAVFMGANTYIGNAPNFMVKSIAEESGVEMPSFFGYILRWALPVLIPIFALATWVFFR